MLPLDFAIETLAPGVVLLPGRAGNSVIDAALSVIDLAPPRFLATPWGKKMSAAMTNTGALGWVSDQKGYRYTKDDPLAGVPWPPMPAVLLELAVVAAGEAGYHDYAPDACLVNVYGPDAKMGLHQDRDEHDFAQPIVSVSLGRAARFRFGGMMRSGPTKSVILHHGDIVVFGGPARLMYHGIDRLEGPPHPALGDRRINLTFRRVMPTDCVCA